ncbi:hypothetical protein DPMN_159895 [Dreissena polymorpha]|uniref:Uncharacterized protein n=1 Tax=Dreissena polymorpha TaxID=45954 RepID=A0A9D4IR43_DREPO|nr:hypothetical protein DPMN_159895 [Dreissena polymorpha]
MARLQDEFKQRYKRQYPFVLGILNITKPPKNEAFSPSLFVKCVERWNANGARKTQNATAAGAAAVTNTNQVSTITSVFYRKATLRDVTENTEKIQNSNKLVVSSSGNYLNQPNVYFYAIGVIRIEGAFASMVNESTQVRLVEIVVLDRQSRTRSTFGDLDV